MKIEDQRTAKIIFVVRDPRSILISGLNYFKINFFKAKVSEQRLLKRGINHILSRTTFGKKILRTQIKKAIFSGNRKLSTWTSLSWAEHFDQFLGVNNNVLVIKYENLREKLYVKF